MEEDKKSRKLAPTAKASGEEEENTPSVKNKPSYQIIDVKEENRRKASAS